MEKANKKYDLVVIGGGPAGISCAYCASKLGLKTLLVEKKNYLGGQITGALVVPMMKSASNNLNTDFYSNLIKYFKKYDAQITYSDGNEGWLNPVLAKIIFEKMLTDVGVDILYEAEICDVVTADVIFPDGQTGKKISSVLFKTADFGVKSSKILSVYIDSKYFVDATGNSDFCRFLNCDFIDDKGKIQPSSLRFLVSGINLEKFAEQILSLDPDRNVTTASVIVGRTHLSTAYTFDSGKKWGLEPLFKEAVKNGDLKYADTAYFQVFSVAGMPGTLAYNCPRLQNADTDAVLAYSKALIEARECIYRIFNFSKKYFDGFDEAYISQIADCTGVRVFERPKTRYIYKIDDIVSSKTFDNPVLEADYPVDIHSNKKDSSTLQCVKKYYFPLEGLLSVNYDNLLVAGRNAGAEFEPQAALRIQKSCMSMGEGAARYIKEKLAH